MKVPVVLYTILSIGHASIFSNLENEIEWNTFKNLYRKKYANLKEEQTRMAIFMENKKKITEHNKKFINGEVTYQMGFNEYGDTSHEEFLRAIFGPFESKRKEQKEKFKGVDLSGERYVSKGDMVLPSGVDWREMGVVTPPRRQGRCGSCWAFSATAAIESQYLRNGRNVSSLSPQNLIDCAGDYGNYGCKGGFRNNAFKYVIRNGGINTEASYPYEAKDDTCRYKATHIGATLTSFVTLPEGDIQALKEVLVYTGPVGVAMDAKMETLQFYSSGVYYDPTCWKTRYDLNHDMLMVGYGTENDTDFWIIKNSWGETWGEAGFLRISAVNKSCGIATIASYPIISEDSSGEICLELTLMLNCFLFLTFFK